MADDEGVAEVDGDQTAEHEAGDGARQTEQGDEGALDLVAGEDAAVFTALAGGEDAAERQREHAEDPREAQQQRSAAAGEVLGGEPAGGGQDEVGGGEHGGEHEQVRDDEGEQRPRGVGAAPVPGDQGAGDGDRGAGDEGGGEHGHDVALGGEAGRQAARTQAGDHVGVDDQLVGVAVPA